jgi:hypothetical protein
VHIHDTTRILRPASSDERDDIPAVAVDRRAQPGVSRSGRDQYSMPFLAVIPLS